MCAAVVTPPLREPQHYSPKFKVEVCLSQPLWPTDKCLHEVMSLCAVLELLCKKEASQMQRDQRPCTSLSTAFKDKSRIIVDQLQAISSKLPQGDIMTYTRMCHLEELYPRAVCFLQTPTQVATNVTWAAMDDHLMALASLQKIQGLAAQINNDMNTLENHKYIAHQLALLHQSLSALSKVSYMSDFKQNIEGQFPTIKQCINEAQDKGNNPHLPQETRQWLQDLTAQIIQVCHNPPPEIQECLQPAAQMLINNL